MGSGRAPHYKEHRPLYPEYGFSPYPTYRNLYLLEGYRFYDRNGHAYPVQSTTDVLNFLADNSACCYTHSINESRVFPYLDGMVSHDACKVICSKLGTPYMGLISVGRSTRWIVQADTWYEVADPGIINRMIGLFNFVSSKCEKTIWYAPTPSSLGRKTMQYIYWREHLGRHTALSLACEEYIRSHGFGGIAITPGLGENYDVAAYLDEAAAYASKWGIQPDEGASWTSNGRFGNCATWFAECEVEITSELALGPFPRRRSRSEISEQKDWNRKNDYPTLPGVYQTYLWKEQAEDCEQAGVIVRPRQGYCWDKFTGDNEQWAQWAYGVRESAPAEHIKKKFKVVIVAAMGRHFAGRTHYHLIDELRADPDRDVCVPDSFGRPLAFFVRSEWDSHTARMAHWDNYTVMQTNRSVYRFALPYAKEAKLILIDTDCVIVVEDDEGYRYAHKIPKAEILLGEWCYTQLHQLEVLGHRKFRSLEITRLPGVGNATGYIPGYA